MDRRASEIPSRYDLWYRTPVGQASHTIELSLIRQAAGRFYSGSILEVGRGTGQFLLPMAREASRAVGVDADSDMLKEVRHRAEQEGLQLELYEADARRLPFPNDAFDVVYENTMLCDLPDPAPAIAEMARVTRSGGRIVLGELSPRSPWHWWCKLRAAFGRGWFRTRNPHPVHGLEAELAKHARLVLRRDGIFFPPLNFSVHCLLRFERIGRLLWPWFGAYTVIAAEKEA